MKSLTVNEEEEILLQKKLYAHINNFDSFRFNSGAGAGKTYALVDVIKYIIKNKFKELENRNQQVICITYTNVAVNEIRERLGSTDLILISTIHDRLWDLIKPYQTELVCLHFEKIKNEIDKISNELADTSHEKLKMYANLNEDEKENFKQFCLDNIDIYKSSKDLLAKEFKEAYSKIDNKPDTFNSLIKNVGNFKEILKHLYKKDKYKTAINQINTGEKNRVKYDSAFNADTLEYMKFSHDTLLEYSEKLFDKYPQNYLINTLSWHASWLINTLMFLLMNIKIPVKA